MIQKSRHPIWDLYDLQREARFLSKLYLAKVHTYSQVILWADLITTLFAGSSAIAGFSFWKSGFGNQAWAIGAGLAAIVSVSKPIFRLTERVKIYQDLYARYTELEHDCEILATKIKNAGKYTDSSKNAVLSLKKNAKTIARNAPPTKFRKKFEKEVQAQVNHELPADRFYIPPA